MRVAVALVATSVLVARPALAEDGRAHRAALELDYEIGAIALTPPASTRLSTIYPFEVPARTVPGAVASGGFQIGEGYRLSIRDTLVIELFSLDLGYSPFRSQRDLGGGATWETHAGWWLKYRLPGAGIRLPIESWQVTVGVRTAYTTFGALGEVRGPRGRYDAKAWSEILDAEADVEICSPPDSGMFTACAYALPAIGLTSTPGPGGAFGIRAKLIPW